MDDKDMFTKLAGFSLLNGNNRAMDILKPYETSVEVYAFFAETEIIASFVLDCLQRKEVSKKSIEFELERFNGIVEEAVINGIFNHNTEVGKLCINHARLIYQLFTLAESNLSK